MTKFTYPNGLILDTDDEKVIQQVIDSAGIGNGNNTPTATVPAPLVVVPAATGKAKKERRTPPFITPFLKDKPNAASLQATARVVIAAINQQLFPDSITKVNKALASKLDDFCNRNYYELKEAHEITSRFKGYEDVYSQSLTAAMYIICKKEDDAKTRKSFLLTSFYEDIATVVRTTSNFGVVKPATGTKKSYIDYKPTAQANQNIVKRYILDRVFGSKAVAAGSSSIFNS